MLYTVVERIEWQAPTIKRSKFIATCFPVSSEQNARNELTTIRRQWGTASHHCWAWRLTSPRIDRYATMMNRQEVLARQSCLR